MNGFVTNVSTKITHTALLLHSFCLYSSSLNLFGPEQILLDFKSWTLAKKMDYYDVALFYKSWEWMALSSLVMKQ